MSLEQQISELNNTIKALTVALGSALAATQIASSTPVAEVADKKTEDKPAKTTKTEAKADKKEDKPATKEVTWKEALDAIMAINKSDKEGHGRPGVTKVMQHFNPDAKKVPELEALGKHAEILAFAKGVLEGTAAADDADDLGI